MKHAWEVAAAMIAAPAWDCSNGNTDHSSDTLAAVREWLCMKFFLCSRQTVRIATNKKVWNSMCDAQKSKAGMMHTASQLQAHKAD